MRALLHELRNAVRSLGRSPGFSSLVVSTLALGTGACVATFSLLDAVMLKPLPYARPERLVALWEANPTQGVTRERVAPLNFADYRALGGTLEDAAAWWRPNVNLADTAGEPVRVAAVETTSNLFSVLGVRPSLGPGFTPSPQIYDPRLEAVISDRLWRERYGADRQILGKTLALNGELYAVVGVMPAGFHFPAETDLWQRQRWDFAQRTRFAHFMESVARLRGGVSLARARTELAALGERLEREHADSNRGWRAELAPLQGEIVGSYAAALAVLMAAVALLFLLACANGANLLLTRASVRERETAVHTALGASRGRLLGRLVLEAGLLCAAGALAGTVLAGIGVRLFAAARPLDLPRLSEVTLSARVLAIGGLAALVALLLFAGISAVQLRRSDLQSALRQAGRGASASLAARRVRGGLALVEIALATVLLVGAGLLLRSVDRLLAVETGFQSDRVLTANIELPASQYGDWSRIAGLQSELLERLAARGEISAAGAASFLPLEPGWVVGYTAKDRPANVAGEELRAQYITATPGFFETLGVPLLSGRLFEGRDTADAPAAVIVNEALARRAWPNEPAVGKILTIGTRGFGPLGRAVRESRDYEVVGVVAGYKNKSLEGEAEPALFFAHTQFPYRNLSLVVRGTVGTEALAETVRAELRRLDATVPLARVQPFEQILGAKTARARFLSGLMTGFAALALLLATVGIYGMLAYGVSQRANEMSVRQALGASPQRVERQVVLEGMLLAGLGVTAGALLALLLGRAMSSVLYGVEPSDTLTFAVAILVNLALCLAASYLPARRAARSNPNEALRGG